MSILYPTTKMVLRVKRENPHADDDEIQEIIEEMLADMAEDRDIDGEPMDTDCLGPEQCMNYHS